MPNLPRRHAESSAGERPVAFLVADDDAGMRSLVGASARGTITGLTVLEAEDGAEAIRLGLQQQPRLALLDVNMPRIDGLDVALVLRELLPQLRLALMSGDARSHRDRAQTHGLPLFDKSDLDGAIRWVSVQAMPRREQSRKLSLVCEACGYGISRAMPPRRCPMCHGAGRWLRRPSPLAVPA